jgi:hypothetical protein
MQQEIPGKLDIIQFHETHNPRSEPNKSTLVWHRGYLCGFGWLGLSFVSNPKWATIA